MISWKLVTKIEMIIKIHFIHGYGWNSVICFLATINFCYIRALFLVLWVWFHKKRLDGIEHWKNCVLERLRALSLVRSFDHVYTYISTVGLRSLYTLVSQSMSELQYLQVNYLLCSVEFLLDAEYYQYCDNTIFAVTFSDMNKKWGCRNVSIWLRKGTLLAVFLYSYVIYLFQADAFWSQTSTFYDVQLPLYIIVENDWNYIL